MALRPSIRTVSAMSRRRRRAKVGQGRLRAQTSAASVKRPTPQQAQVALMRNVLPAALVEQLKLHHSVYLAPAKAEQLEELVSNALTNAGLLNDWAPGSHAVSTDITLEASGATLSVKSGTVANGVLEISGSRLGKNSTSVASMLADVKARSAQFYVSVAKVKTDWSGKVLPSSEKRYQLFIFPADLLDYGTGDEWTTRSNANGKTVYTYEATRGAISKAEIRASMSHQLWTRIDISKLPPPISLVVPGRPNS